MDENEKLFVKNYCWDILKKAVKKPNVVRNREMFKSREKIFNFLSLLSRFKEKAWEDESLLSLYDSVEGHLIKKTVDAYPLSDGKRNEVSSMFSKDFFVNYLHEKEKIDGDCE